MSTSAELYPKPYVYLRGTIPREGVRGLDGARARAHVPVLYPNPHAHVNEKSGQCRMPLSQHCPETLSGGGGGTHLPKTVKT